jgi:hypothetical protein
MKAKERRKTLHAINNGSASTEKTNKGRTNEEKPLLQNMIIPILIPNRCILG